MIRFRGLNQLDQIVPGVHSYQQANLAHHLAKVRLLVRLDLGSHDFLRSSKIVGGFEVLELLIDQFGASLTQSLSLVASPLRDEDIGQFPSTTIRCHTGLARSLSTLVGILLACIHSRQARVADFWLPAAFLGLLNGRVELFQVGNRLPAAIRSPRDDLDLVLKELGVLLTDKRRDHLCRTLMLLVGLVSRVPALGCVLLSCTSREQGIGVHRELRSLLLRHELVCALDLVLELKLLEALVQLDRRLDKLWVARRTHLSLWSSHPDSLHLLYWCD